MAKTVQEKKMEKFKTFNETFNICAFGLALGLIYPNKHNVVKRALLAFFIIAVNFAELFWFCNYLVESLQRGDLYNFCRNVSLVIVVTLFFFKSFYVNYKNIEFQDLLTKISKDLLKGNELEEDYKEIYRYHIKQAKIGEIVWVVIPIIFAAQFPLYAGIGTIYESLKSDVGKRYMQHDIDLRFIQDKQYDTPYYEIVFGYNFLQCFFLMPNFVGFDGSFCIATTHLRLKLKLMVHRIQRAFEDFTDIKKLRSEIKEAVKEHQEALQFYNDIQGIYGGWLLSIFALTSFIISFNLYQIYLMKKIELRYAIFVISGVIHIYAPCHYAATLLEMNENLGSDIYCCPWENIGDDFVTKLLIFMIAKAQQPMLLTGKGLVIFNMQLFISIMQTSYSFFTLITS